MSCFEWNGKQIYYTETGSGKPVLLLHGNTASSRMFGEVIEDYAQHCMVITMDFLGHGRSGRLDSFPADLWYFEAEQVIAFLKAKNYGKVNLIGSSGGALVAINVALETPELIEKVIADSFEGEKAVGAITDSIQADRSASKLNAGARQFYKAMHGSDWEQVVDNDTSAILRHAREIGNFFHQELSSLQPDILLTGSRQDEFACAMAQDFFEKTYTEMLRNIGHGSIRLFDTGGHPAMLSNPHSFLEMTTEFFEL